MGEEKRPSLVSGQLETLLRKNHHLLAALANIDDETGSGHTGSRGEGGGSGNSHSRSPTPSEGHSSDHSHEDEEDVASDFVDLSAELGASEELGWWESLLARVGAWGVEVLEALSEAREDETGTERKSRRGGQKFHVQDLVANAKRCAREGQGYLSIAAGIEDVMLWRHPLSSLALALVYFYSLFHGFLIPLLLVCLLLQLGLNYLHHVKGISVGLLLLPYRQVDELRLDDTKLINRVFRLAACSLQLAADIAEKVSALMTWKNPGLTTLFAAGVAFWAFMFAIFSLETNLILIGMLGGGKFFITSYAFHRFPRLRHQLDVAVWFADRLPTAAELERRERRMRAAVTKRESQRSAYSAADVVERMGEVAEEMEERRQSALSNLRFFAAATANPNMQRQCVLQDRERPFPHTYGSGTLIVTESKLTFRYRRAKTEVIEIPFSSILAAEKVKSLSWLMPTSPSRAMEVSVMGRDKPLLFLGISKRDELYSEILQLSAKAGCDLSSHKA